VQGKEVPGEVFPACCSCKPRVILLRVLESFQLSPRLTSPTAKWRKPALESGFGKEHPKGVLKHGLGAHSPIWEHGERRIFDVWSNVKGRSHREQKNAEDKRGHERQRQGKQRKPIQKQGQNCSLPWVSHNENTGIS